MTGFNPAYEDAEILPPPPPMNAEKRQRKKNKSGAFGIFRAALTMLRKRSDEKKEKSKGGGGGEWKKIVHSMRPLHVQEMPASPLHGYGADSPAVSSSGTMSQYASATNLQDLCKDEEMDEVFDAIEGDDMIDSKAEEFIAQFHKSIHHQNSIHLQDRGV